MLPLFLASTLSLLTCQEAQWIIGGAFESESLTYAERGEIVGLIMDSAEEGCTFELTGRRK